MIQVKNLYKQYDNQYLYKDFNISFEEGKIIGILGTSGCGKTTLLRILSQLEPYEKGQISGIQDKRIAYIFQEDRLVPWLTVYQNVELVLKGKHSPEVISLVIRDILNELQLKKYRDCLPEKLSGGMKRRVAIGRAICYDAEILLMDEPFKGLDTQLKQEVIQNIVERQRKSNQTLIWVTHDIDEIKNYADSLYNLEGSPVQSQIYQISAV